MKNRQNISYLKLVIILLATSLLLLTTACQSTPQQKYNTQTKQSTLPVTKKEVKDTKYSGSHPSPAAETTQRMIIKEANLGIVTADLAVIPAQIKQLAADYNGYIANSHQWENNQQRKYYNYTIRIPEQHFNQLISKLKTLGDVKEERLSGRDVTEQYIDLQARLKNLTSQETRYLDLLEKADKVEAILKIEKELNRVRTEIERLQGRLDYYKNKVNLATINLQIYEPQPILTPGWNLQDSFKQAVQAFVNSISLIIILIGKLLPWGLLLLILGGLIYKFIIE